jgi:hypothetical protein
VPVAGDDHLCLPRYGRFQNPVIVRIIGNELDGLSRFNNDAHPPEQRFRGIDSLIREAELLPQDSAKFLKDRWRKNQAYRCLRGQTHDGFWGSSKDDRRDEDVRIQDDLHLSARALLGPDLPDQTIDIPGADAERFRLLSPVGPECSPSVPPLKVGQGGGADDFAARTRLCPRPPVERLEQLVRE